MIIGGQIAVDLALSDEQEMLKTTARRFLEKECPKTIVRQLLASREGHSEELWRAIAELGWLGLPLPEEYGGAGLRFLDLAVILEELGRSLLPSPYFATVLSAYTLRDAAAEGRKSAMLTDVASGNLVLTLAYLETGASYDACAATMRAVSHGESFVLDGVKLFVPYAHVADRILTIVRMESQHGDGMGIVLVDGHDPAVKSSLLRPIDDSKLCEVAYHHVRVAGDAVIAGPDTAPRVIERMLARAAIGECLQLVGAAQAALELTLEYVKSRVQFGQVIGSFQAMQHHCANMATDLDCARLLTYRAASIVDEGLPSMNEVAMAKAWVGNACRRIAGLAHQCHGGTGYIAEHDLTLYSKRVREGEFAYGNAAYHYDRLGQRLLEEARIELHVN